MALLPSGTDSNLLMESSISYMACVVVLSLLLKWFVVAVVVAAAPFFMLLLLLLPLLLKKALVLCPLKAFHYQNALSFYARMAFW